MKTNSILLLFLFIQSFAFSQNVEDAWVYFKDKPSSATYLSNPLTMLSQRALDRRTNQNISLDNKDVPLETSYVSSIESATGISVKAKSKWLNAVHVQGTKTNIDVLLNIAAVDSIDFGNKALNKVVSKSIKRRNKFFKVQDIDNLNYGDATNQITMLHGDYLHGLGYKGEGYQIAVIDAGFKGVESFAAFSRLRDSNLNNGEILGGYDFVNRNSNFYADTGSTHGLSVLSTIGAYIDAQFIGTAPNAHFYLYVTEDDANETPLEESLWVEAAERADSLGVDIINTSLGYTTFDDDSYNYTNSDMDGKTTFISRGAEIASSRGIMLVTSAGNSGGNSWKYIGAPADAASGLTVGAVDASENIASFSSYGPSAANKIKPEVLAQGKNVYVINSIGEVGLSNGTSFSSPIMAGLVACLWQSFPSKTALELKQLIIESGDLFANSTDQKGYGIPDFESIHNKLSLGSFESMSFQVFPNPVSDLLYVNAIGLIGNLKVEVFDISGKLLLDKHISKTNSEINVRTLNKGIYFVKILHEKQSKTFKIIKQ